MQIISIGRTKIIVLGNSAFVPITVVNTVPIKNQKKPR